MDRHDDPPPRLRRRRLERRQSCGRRGGETDTLQLLLRPRELYVGHLSGASLGLWRVALDDGQTVHIGAPPQRAREGEAPLAWAACVLLEAALGRSADADVADALALELTRLGGRQLALYDVEVRLWYLYWGLVSEPGGEG